MDSPTALQASGREGPKDNYETRLLLTFWQGQGPEPKERRDKHTEHCCVDHGCKYENPECPVVTRTKRQTCLCENCYDYERFPV